MSVKNYGHFILLLKTSMIYKIRLILINFHNRINEYKIKKRDEKHLIKITKTYIKHCKNINSEYTKKN